MRLALLLHFIEEATKSQKEETSRVTLSVGRQDRVLLVTLNLCAKTNPLYNLSL